MSLFKRKHAKEKETPAERDVVQIGASPTGPPNSSNPPGMPPQAQGSRPSIGPQMTNGPPVAGQQIQQQQPRRMTSGPMQTTAPNGHPSGSQDLSGSPQTVQTAPPQARPPAPASSAQYPWSYRPIRLYPSTASPPAAPTNPFPRYGLAVPAFPSHSGHMLIFGGLVHDHVRNDLWSMDVRDCSTMQVQTRGQMPAPRVGHASAMADRIMLMWGGDTKVKPEDKQDEGLYVLDLRSQEWTSVPIASGPAGRYGHAACLLDSRFYIFGGQAEGAFMDDLWSYDIRQAFSGDGNKHVWEKAQYKTPPPSPRTGHVLLSCQNMLYVFGGTDGNFHYNDTWRFDPSTGEWTELFCTGYIPVPREGHAAAIVDDMVYVFGGRDVNGKDLGDLAAFSIPKLRWFMFQNMGPAPSARSGHSMVAAKGTIFVLGGEANAANGASKDDPSLIHMLDTVKIKFPADRDPARQGQNSVDRLPNGAESPQRHVQVQDSPQSSRRFGSGSESVDSLARAASPPVTSERIGNLPMQPMLAALAPPISTRAQIDGPPAETGPQNAAPPGSASRAQPNGPPQRPRREGDDDYRRAMSPVANGPSSPVQPLNPARMVSPTNGPASPPQLRNGFNPSLLGTRSPSPRLRQAEGMDRPAPPPDAFYYGRSPTGNNFSGTNRPGSSSSSDLVRELRANQVEVEASRKREGAMKVLLARAMQQGFVLEDEGVELPNGKESPQADEDMVRTLMAALVRMKQEKAVIQNELVNQLRAAGERAAESDRLRRGALQEAAFYRAKISSIESSSSTDVSRLERERIAELESQISTLSSGRSEAQRELDQLRQTASSDQQLLSEASEREAEASQRADEAEDAYRSASEELEALRQEHGSMDTALRDHSERMITLTSSAQQREAERDHLRSQLDEASAGRDDHISLIEKVQAAIAVAGTRTAEVEGLHQKSTARIADLEAELSELRLEAESRTRDAELSAERLAEVEAAYAKSRAEADSLRQVTAGQLGELLNAHKERQTSDTRAIRGHSEQMRALEEESKSLRKMLREAGQRLEDAEAGVSHHRSKARDLETSHQSLKSHMRAVRGKHVQTQQELAKHRDLYNARESELRDRDLAITEAETRCTVLRNLLADHGIAVSDRDLEHGEMSSTRELESQLRERTRAQENAQREIDELNRRCLEAEDKVESLGRLVDRMKDARSPTGMSMRSPSPSGDSGSRVLEQARKMAEMEAQHKDKLAALESDYQTAVRYVKGTEKMLKRMKDELNKQKQTNTSMQSEIDNLRGRPSEAGARTRDVSGRSTPSADPELQRRLATLQTQHTALQAELAVSRDVLSAREREVDLMRMRMEEAEREVEILREDLVQAQQRIATLLEVGGPSGYDLESELGDDHDGRGSEENSEEASMAFDKFTNELKQWERTRSPSHGGNSEDDTIQHNDFLKPMAPAGSAKDTMGHKRHSSEYSGDWTQ